MNIHQFRFVQEAVRRNLNLTETARALHTSQPGVSKAIIELEEELGVEIFARHGKRLKRVTEPGVHVLKSIELIMREVWGYSDSARTRTLDTHVKRVREKLGAVSDWVHTVRSYGYAFRKPEPPREGGV